ISTITEQDSEFTAEIYRLVYAREVVEEAETRLGHSQILPLRSNARQDFDMARYSLAEHFPDFFKREPLSAAMALVEAVEGYVAREHAPSTNVDPVEIAIDGYEYLLKADLS